MRFKNNVLRDYRLSKNFTQQEFSDLIGIDRVTYIYIEKGKRKPGFKTIKIIAKAMSVTSEELRRELYGNR